jgi:ClpP class serine protease
MTEDLDVDLQRHSAALKSARRTMNQQLETIDVPQADELDRVVRFVKLVANGESVNAKSLGVVSRQVAYYKSAAKILGLLDEEGSLTPAAQYLLRAPKSKTDQLLLTYFATSKCGNAWLTWADESQFHDLDPDSAEDFLEQTTELSQSTRHRRAQTLTAWWRRLAGSGQT